MVDKELIFIARNENYGFLRSVNSQGQTITQLTYANGDKLSYGDPAEIFPAIAGIDFNDFMQSALSGTYFTREHYWFTLGYQPADYENEEIKSNDVKIHYAGVDNIISKKDFYDLCLWLCNAKLQTLDLNGDSQFSREKILSIKSQLEERIKTIQQG